MWYYNYNLIREISQRLQIGTFNTKEKFCPYLLNTYALKCYEKCGFKEYGIRRKCKFVNGKYYDSISMDILAEEFEGDFIRNKNI